MTTSSSPKRLTGRRLLVIDDSPDIGLLHRRILQREGAEVDTALGGAAGISMALATPYHLILLDLEMPDMSGTEAVGKLRQAGYTQPVVALSAHADQARMDGAVKAGFDGFMVKSGDWGQLVDQLQPWLHLSTLP